MAASVAPPPPEDRPPPEDGGRHDLSGDPASVARAICLRLLTDRARTRAELATATTFRLFNGEWDKVQVVETSISAHARYEQQTIADIARATRRNIFGVDDFSNDPPMSNAEREQLVAFMGANPEAGKIMQETGGVRKLRWALSKRLEVATTGEST
jgi:hypothetical protein